MNNNTNFRKKKTIHNISDQGYGKIYQITYTKQSYKKRSVNFTIPIYNTYIFKDIIIRVKRQVTIQNYIKKSKPTNQLGKCKQPTSKWSKDLEHVSFTLSEGKIRN